MRIVKFKEFLSLPVGTVYCKYNPDGYNNYSNFDNLAIVRNKCIYDNTHPCTGDWIYESLVAFDHTDSGDYADKLEQAEQDSQYSLTLVPDCQSRDGLDNEQQLFAVLDKEDIITIMTMLLSALNLQQNK
jgi:hypothetical protein